VAPPFTPPATPSPLPPACSAWWPGAGLLLLGSLGFAAAWILLGSRYERLFTPLAVLAALDIALVLHLARVRCGARRAILAALVTAACMFMAIGGLICTRIGLQLGLSPWEAAQRLGVAPAWQIAVLSLDRVDLAWLLAGLVVAVVLSR